MLIKPNCRKNKVTHKGTPLPKISKRVLQKAVTELEQQLRVCLQQPLPLDQFLVWLDQYNAGCQHLQFCIYQLTSPASTYYSSIDEWLKLVASLCATGVMQPTLIGSIRKDRVGLSLRLYDNQGQLLTQLSVGLAWLKPE